MKKRTLSGTRGQWFFWAGLILWLAFFVEHLDVWQGHEILSIDYLSRLSHRQDLDELGIVFVSIDSDEFKKFFDGKRPLSPDIVMATIEQIALARPKVIAVAIDTTNPEYRRMPTELPCSCQKSTPATPETEVPTTSGQKTEMPEKTEVPCVPIVWAREPASPDPPFNPDSPVVPGVVLGGLENPKGPSAAGISTLFTDDGAVRRYKWVFETTDGHYADSLALAALKVIRQAHISQPLLLAEECRILNRGPKDCLNLAFIHYSMGRSQRVFTFQDLAALSKVNPASMRGKATASAEDWKQWLGGKIVFVGAEFPDGQNPYPTPAGYQYAVRIHAEALASELANKTIWVRSRWVVIPSEIVALCILFFLQHWIRRPAVRFWIIFLGMLVFSVGLSCVAFGTWRALLNFIPLLAAIFLDVVKDLAAERMSVS